MKFWWKGEPIIYGSNRFNVINNDLLQDFKSCLAQYKAHTTIEDMVRIAHKMKSETKRSAKARYADDLEIAATAVGCLQTAIELCHIGDTKSAMRWTERADEKLKRMAAMPNASNSATGDRGASPANADGKA